MAIPGLPILSGSGSGIVDQKRQPLAKGGGGGIDYLTTIRPRDIQLDQDGKCCDCALDDWIEVSLLMEIILIAQLLILLRRNSLIFSNVIESDFEPSTKYGRTNVAPLGKRPRRNRAQRMGRRLQR